jgi:hypothetical protein
MDYGQLFAIADRARGRGKLTGDDIRFVRETAPSELAAFPHLNHPKSVRHPAGFSISGAPVGTFTRVALLLAGREALGPRYGGEPFYERVESDLALRIMRANFHGGAPKGAFCCKQCTLAVLPVLEADAIRWFDGPPLAAGVRELIAARAWRFNTPANAAMTQWALAGPAQ